ncbi:D-alanyl-D-alanine carboxypeptidase family protein [Helcococcus sueciensis]|uniref:D-alanyl-D-alanine carboxypeptidase family protein n=1 Tax=Helcococcus sueciensis TaxID=241555 RepID=UPI000402EB4D|nr:D-alanyl-D-alanine carboxypeptidase family protein [Helcococcus sueciensis]
MKKRFVLLLAFIIAFINLNTASAYSILYEDQARAIYAADLETGLEFYKKNEDEILPIASMSKIMTYLLAMDEIKKGKISLDDEVTITKESAELNQFGYSRLELDEGEKVRFEDLISGMMIVSGNDAANAVAIHTFGSIKNFVNNMNKKAKELGLESANFVNPSGITEYPKSEKEKVKLNVMSAKDLYKLSVHVVKNYPEVMKYGETEIFNIPSRNYSAESTIPLKDIKSRVGLKTGSTPEALYGFTGLFDMKLEDETQDYRMISVVIGAETKEVRNELTREIYNYVTNNYAMKMELNPNIPLITKMDSSTKQREIPLYPEKGIKKLMSKTNSMDVDYSIDESKKAPYEDGEILGKATLSYNGEVVDTINLINKGYVPKATFIDNFIESILEFFDKVIFLF